MPRRTPKLIVAAMRTAEARCAVDNQHGLITRLKVARHPTSEAEQTLQAYLSILANLEAHEQKLRNARRAKKTSTKKKPEISN